jgi:hypothetical protein
MVEELPSVLVVLEVLAPRKDLGELPISPDFSSEGLVNKFK